MFADPVTGDEKPDLSIIRLQTPLQLNDNLQPIRLPNREWGNWGWEGAEIAIMGFGNDNSGSPARILQFGYFRVQTCAEMRDWEFCATPSRNLTTSTQAGDAG